MGATTQSGNGRKLYYSVSYGKLATRVKEVPEDFTEIVEANLKASVQAVEQVDLRKKYVNKAKGDYPYNVFYDALTGVILEQEKFTNDNGTNLNLTILDTDGDTSILQVKFYSKYAENLLNRLLNTNTSQQFTFTPYQIPAEAEIEGKKKQFYNQGVSLKVNGEKVEVKYKSDDKELPPTEQVKVQGQIQTSRDNRLDFLYKKFVAHFKPSGEVAQPKEQAPKATPKEAFEPAGTFNPNVIPNTDLPF